MAVVASFVADKTEGSVPLVVTFTDTSTDSPTDWLWEFGDGFLSKDQNPVHTYVGTGVFTVRLTAWKSGSVVNVGAAGENLTGSLQNTTLHIYSTYAAANAAFNATLPYTDWAGINGANIIYQITEDVGGDWAINGRFIERATTLSSYSPTTHVAWMEHRLSPLVNNTKQYSDGVNHALKIGKWDGSAFDGNESTFDIVNLPRDLSDIPIYNMVDYLGNSGTTTFRCIDAYEFDKDLSDPLATNATGYVGSGNYPFHQVRSMASSNLDSITNSNFITANSNIITRPAQLYSGIKEAYFKDGWENEKYLYIEQEKAHPCVVQFVDAYAETENE